MATTVAQATTLEDLELCLAQACEDCGLSHFLIVDLPILAGDTLSSRSIMNNWPDELIATFDTEVVLHDWPCLQLLKRRTTPHSREMTDRNGNAPPDGVATLHELLHRHGMPYGHIFPVHDACGHTGCVLFSGAVAEIGAAGRGCLQMTSNHIFNRLAGLRDAREWLEVLTSRELECLCWTAAGKTSSEIAQLLELSGHTVNHHLSNAARKMGAFNRTNAVARAIRLGLIPIP